MKIISFIDPAKRLKFRNVLDMTLEEYVVWFRKTRPGNKPFKDLYNNVVEHLNLPNVDDDIEDLPALKDPLVEKLNGIPL